MSPAAWAFSTTWHSRIHAGGVATAAGAREAIVGCAVVATLGGVGVAAVPYSLNETVHNASAVTYYASWIALTLVLLAVASRHRMSAALAVTDAAVAVTSTVFSALVFAGYRPGTSGPAWPAAVAEWCTYAALLSWVAAHALAPVEGSARRQVRSSGDDRRAALPHLESPSAT